MFHYICGLGGIAVCSFNDKKIDYYSWANNLLRVHEMLRASEWEAEFDIFLDYSLILAASHTADCAELFFATPDTLTTQRSDAQWKWSQRLAGGVHELCSGPLTFIDLVAI